MDILHSGLYGWFLLSVIFLVSAGVSYLFYRKTEISDFKKAVLFVLRTASLFLILSLLLNPFFTTKSNAPEKLTDIILIDNSQSLNIENRFRELPDAAGTVKKLSPEYRMFAFGSGLLNEIKSGSEIYSGSAFRTYETDLAAALENIYSMPGDFSVNSVTVISDGIIKQNAALISAAKKFGAPFYYYIVGDTVQKKDALIKQVYYNRNAYAGSTATIKLLVNSFGYTRNFNISLYEEGILKQNKVIPVNLSTDEYTPEFKVTSALPGVKKYSVVLDTAEGEITVLNNRRDLFIKYSENRFKVLVIAGSPGADFSAFRQSLSKFENFTSDYFVGKTPDSFYEGALPPLKGYSALFLFGFPLAGTDRQLAEKISKEAIENNIPVIFFNASNTGSEILKTFENLLPFTVNGQMSNTYTAPVRVLPFNAPEEPEPIRKISVLPPAYFTKGMFSPRPGSTVLGTTASENEPALFLYNDGRTRSAAFTGYGIYKWTLNNSAETGNAIKDLAAVLFNLVLEGSASNKFYIISDKDCYAFSEPVGITAFDGGAGSASVMLKITGKNFSREFGMERSDATSFRFSFTPDSVSDYSAEGMLFTDKQLIAGDAIRFSSGFTPDEYIITKSTPDLLRILASNTGGTDIRTFGKSAFEKRQISGRNRSEENKFLLRDSLAVLLTIIFLLSLEWFLRKRFNQP